MFRHVDRAPPLVLVADDDPTTRLVIVELLSGDGLRVAEAGDGREAVTRALELLPDLLLLDVLMPGLDGFEVCAALRGTPGFRDLPIMVLTGLEDTEALDRAFDAGATDFASKPVNPTLLGNRVRYLLRAARAFRDLRTSETRLENAQRIARLGNWDYSLATGHMGLSAEAARLLGAATPTITLNEFLVRVPGEDAGRLTNALESALRTASSFGLDHRVTTSEGATRFLRTQGAALLDDKGSIAGVTGTLQDITERVEAEARVRTLAFYDTLTGLPNRTLFTDLLRKALTRAARVQKHVAVMFLDLDGFKEINDTLGHRAGDRVLEQVANRLRQVTRDYDPAMRSGESDAFTVGRLGGDEFLLAITDLAKPDDAASVALRILEVMGRPVSTQDGEIRVSTSIGVSVFPQDGADVDELLKNADTALYHAKDQGRNTFEFYSPQLSAATLERRMLESMLVDAVGRAEFRLYYQPQVDAATNRILGAEALLRWQHPTRGLVGPALFINALEQTRLIRELGPWIVRTAATQLKEWHDAGLSDLRMAINLSGSQLGDPGIVDMLDAAVAASGAPRSHIEFEITETVLIHAASEGVNAVNALKARGYRVAMDDFGTGYSSLSYLTRFPVDCLKLDRSFAADFLTNDTHAAVVETMIGLAQRLGIELVIEGVESATQRDRLLACGARRMQGYLFGRPVPEPEFRMLVAGPGGAPGRAPRPGEMVASGH